ncbi:MAG: hypothetical protein GX649_11670, partial [Chloroflexi bacterium]|nr:hypothetical protein [Chloroflexota bacterium]
QEYLVSDAVLARWFGTASEDGRPSYAEHLASLLDADEIAAVRRLLEAHLRGETRPWTTTVAYVVARR